MIIFLTSTMKQFYYILTKFVSFSNIVQFFSDSRKKSAECQIHTVKFMPCIVDRN